MSQIKPGAEIRAFLPLNCCPGRKPMDNGNLYTNFPLLTLPFLQYMLVCLHPARGRLPECGPRHFSDVFRQLNHSGLQNPNGRNYHTELLMGLDEIIHNKYLGK